MKTSYIILILLLATSLEAQWSNDPNNNLIVGYGADPHICSDSAGGCYITYRAGEPTELFLRRFDKYGYQPWGYKKQILGELTEQWQAEIIEDGEGGVIVSYEDMKDNLPYSFTARVRVQRVDSSGNFLWGSTGVNVSLDSADQGLQQLVTDGDGGCVITWVNVPFTYHINRIDKYGNRLWGDNGIMLGTSAYNSHPRIIRATDGNYYVETGEYIYRIRDNGEIVRRDSVTLGYIVPAPDGGMILSGRVWTGMIPKLVAQRKDTLGNNLWQEPYVEIADSLDINTRLTIQYNNGYYYYSWAGKKNGIDLVVQFQALRLDGTKLFSQGSIPISNYPIDALLGGILPSDSGTVVLIWEDFRPEDGVFGQRIDTLGSKLWDINDVSIYTGMYADLYSTTDGNGGAIGLGWHQFDFSFRIFKVSRNGQLGEVITSVKSKEEEIIPTETMLYQNYPNPFNSSTIIKYQIPKEGRVIINLYNILGEKIKTFVDEYKSAGSYSLTLNSGELPSGVYLYALETNNKVLTKKLTILK